MLKKTVSLFTAFAFMFTQASFGAMITPDGRTDTTVTNTGNTWDVHTGTVSGSTAFNSFANFDVYQGNTANLYLPDNTSNLVNLVSGDKASNINGILNAYKNGKIGGNVFFLNSNGIAVGASGVINVGAITLGAPTKAFMDSVLNADRSVSSAVAQAILNGDIPLNPSGLISVKGKINAASGAGLFGGRVENHGIINTNFTTGDIVNAEGAALDNKVLVKDGKIIVSASEDFVNTGVLSAASQNGDGGEVTVKAGRDIYLEEGSQITTSTTAAKADAGQILVLAGRDSYFNKGALISASAIEGKGGEIELSGKKSVFLNGGLFSAASLLGKGGSVLIDPEDIIITASVFTGGANYSLKADKTIKVNDSLTIDTTLANGNAGNIDMQAKTIELGDNVTLNAKAGTGKTSGDITLKATDLSDSILFLNNSSSVSIGKNAILKGKDINISSESKNKLLFADEDSVLAKIGNVTLGALKDLSLVGGYIDSSVEASVKVDTGANIEAGGNLNISSKATSDASLMVPFTGVAVAVVNSSVDSTVTIGEGVKLKSGGTTDITSSVDSVLSSQAIAVSTAATLSTPGDAAVAVGILDIKNKVDIQKNSEINSGGKTTIKADTKKDMTVSASAMALDDGYLSAAVSYSKADVDSSVKADGKIQSAGNLDIISDVNSVKNKSAASASSGDGTITFYVAKAMNTAIDAFKSFLKIDSINTASQSHSKIGLGAAVSYTEHTNNSSAQIGSNADIKAAGDITLKAQTEDQVIRQSAITSVDSITKKDGGFTKENGGAAAVGIAFYNDNTKAFIDDNAQVDLSGKLDVLSIYSLPYEITWHKIEGIGDITAKLNSNLGLQNGFVNTWAMATATTKKEGSEEQGNFGFAASVNIAQYNSDTKAYIGKTAKINQRSVYSTPGAVNVKAQSDISTVNFSGNTGLTFFGTNAKNGIGASYMQIEYNNKNEAYIDDNAQIKASSLDLASSILKRDITIGVSGGKAESFGFNGTFNWIDSESTTLAHISESAKIESSGDINISADDDTTIFNISGGVTKGENVGIGASVAISDITRNTQAYIGKAYTETSVMPALPFLISAAGKLSISALHTGDIYSYSLAAAIISGSNKGDGQDAQGGGGKYGIGISGDVSYNNIDGDALAYVNGGIIKADEVSLKADDDSHINTVAGAVSISTGGDKGSAGIAGAVSINNIENKVSAFTKNSYIETQKFTANANSYAHMQAISAGGSGAVNDKGFAVAGSVAITNTENEVSSFSEGSTITVTNGDASLAAKDKTSVVSVAGAASVGTTVGVGASVGVNNINNTSQSYLKQTTISAQNISAAADNDSSLTAVSGTIAAAKEGAALAASVTVNKISNTTLAYADNSNLTSSKSSYITASDNSDILAIAGSVGASAGKAGVGISTGVTIINNQTGAYVNGGEVNSAGNIEVKASTATETETASASGAMADGAGVTGSVAVNNIKTDTYAYAKNASLTALGTLGVSALSFNIINFYGGTLALGNKAGLGATVAVNNVEDKSSAYLDNAIVTVKGNNTLKNNKGNDISGLLVEAITQDDINVWTFNAAGSGYGALAGAVSVSNIDNSASAKITGASQINAAIDSSYNDNQSIALNAENKTDVEVYGGAVAIAGQGGIGAVSDTVLINNKTQTSIENSSANAKKDITLDSDTLERYNAILVAGGVGAQGAGIAGNAVVVNIESTNNVLTDKSSLTSGGALKLNAKDAVKVGDSTPVAVGAAAGGLYAGVSGAVFVAQAANKTSAVIRDTSAVSDGGVQVNAASVQKIYDFLPSLAISGGVGIGATAAVTSLDSDTEAYIEETSGGASVITTSKTSGTNDPALSVKASSDSEINNTLSTLAAGGFGVGGAVSVSKINGKTAAGIKSGVEINAQNGEALISAENSRRIDDLVLSLGAGTSGGVNGSISVATIGGNLDNGGIESSGGTKDLVNTELARNNSITTADLGRAGLTDKAATQMAALNLNVNSAFDAAAAQDNSTAAFIGANTKVNAKDVSVKSKETAQMKLLAGGGAAGYTGPAIGSGVAIGNINTSSKAYIGEKADITVADNLTVDAQTEVKDTDATSYIGTVSPFMAALGASVAIINSNNNTQAFIDQYAKVNSANQTLINANAASDIHTQTVGVASGLEAAGASVSRINKDGSTQAYIDDNVNIGKDTQKAGSLTIKAANDNTLFAEAEAGAGGILAGTGTDAKVSASGALNSSLGKNSNIYLNNTFEALTEGKTEASAKTYGVNVGGLAVGVSLASAQINLDNTVNIEGDNIIKAASVKAVAEQKKAKTSVNSMAASGSLIGGTGANAYSKISGNVKTLVGDNTSINADTLKIASASLTEQEITSNLYNVGLAVSVGANIAKAESAVNTQTLLGKGLNITAKTADITAEGADTLYAQSYSGSGGVIDGSGAKVETKNDSSALVKIDAAGGVNNITADNFTIKAQNTTKQDAKASAVSGSIVGAVVLLNTNTSDMDVKVDLQGTNNIKSNKLAINALNNYYKDKYQYSLDSTAVGVISVPVTETETKINNYTDIVLGDNTKINITRNANGESDFTANAFNNINATSQARLISGGLVMTPDVENSIINQNNYARITINNAAVKTQDDLNLNVKSDVDLDAKTQISVYGVSGIANGKTKAETVINNNIVLNSGADVFALGNANFGLTQPKNGERAKIYTDAVTDIWNRTAVPIDSGSEAKGFLTLNNNVDIKNGAKLRSAKDINIKTSDAIVGASGLLSIYSAVPGIELASKNNAAQTKINQTSTLKVDGQLLAGVNNTQHITINEDKTVTISNPDADITYTLTQESLSNNILNEITRLKTLKQQYSGSDILSGAYQTEINRLEAQLEALGLIDNSNGTTLYTKVDNVDFITFSDISANRGDININADILSGSGKLYAPGFAEVTINNNSPLFLRLNDILISDLSHGDIVFNGIKVASSNEIQQINRNNTAAAFSSVTSGAASSQTPVITVNNTYSKDGKGSNLELLGSIENKEGTITINSEGSIYAKGHIRGNTINIASSKDIVQSYTDGFRHIGGEPSEAWAQVAASAEKGKTDLSNDSAAKSGISSIIGNNVFLSGRYLNINGLVQSGVADWSLNIPSGALNLANSLNPASALADYNARLAKKEAGLSELYALSSEYGNIPAFYNVLTGQIVLKDFAVEGGKLELYGHILNTGGTAGELRALDGYGRVNINNLSGKDIVIASVDNSKKVMGQIKITDLAKKASNGDFLSTVYTFNNGSVTAVDNNGGNTVTSGRQTNYNPLTGQRYVWTTGQETLTKETYTKSNNSFWGMDFLVPDESSYDKSSMLLSQNPLLEGEILDLNNTSDTHTYSYDYEGPVVLSKIKTYDERWTETHGWWIFSTKEYHHKLIYETGSKEFHTHSIKADSPIKINFIGYDSAQTNINSNSNLLLSSAISAGQGSVNLSATNGAISSLGNGYISAKDINLTSATGIGGAIPLNLQLNGGVLNAQTNAGNINIAAKAYKDANGNTLEVKTGKITTGSGDVVLAADGSILSADSSSLIKGGDVKLSSGLGSIGSLSSFVNTQADIISASAKGDITIKQASGDLGINSISSALGEVNLDIAGSVYDANENEQADTRTQTELLNTWNNMELTGAAGWTLDQLKYAVNESSLKNTIDTQYSTEDPNITANKVTIKAGGSIGKDMGSEVISLTDYSALTDEQKLLIASSESDNLLFNYQEINGKQVPVSVTVYKTEDLDIHSSDITLNANKYIYLGGEQDININSVTAGTGENITIRGAKGIYNVSSSTNPNITGKDLVLEAADGGAGTILNPLVLNLTGKIIARAKDNMYLTSPYNLNIDSLLSMGSVNLTAGGNILSAVAKGQTNIKAGGVNLEADNIGEDSKALTVELDQTSAQPSAPKVLNAKADKNLNIYGNGSGDFYTDKITAGQKAVLEAHAGLKQLAQDSLVKAKNISLKAQDNIGSASDRYSVEGDTVALQSGADIGLLANAALISGTSAGYTDILSVNTAQTEFKDISADKGFKADAQGSVKLNNIDSDYKGISVNSQYGDIDSINGLSAKENIELTAKENISLGSFTVSSHGDINADSLGGDIIIKDGVEAAAGKLSLTAFGSIQNTNGVSGVFAQKINLDAKNGSIGQKQNLFKINSSLGNSLLEAAAAKDIFIGGLDSSVKLASLTSYGGDIFLDAEGSIEAAPIAQGQANIKANNITLHAENGHIGKSLLPVSVRVNSEGGKINLLAANGIYVKNLIYTFVADYVKNTKSGNIRLNVPTNNVKIAQLIKQEGFEVILDNKINISAIVISGEDIKKTMIDPVSSHQGQPNIPSARLTIFQNTIPQGFMLQDFELQSNNRHFGKGFDGVQNRDTNQE